MTGEMKWAPQARLCFHKWGPLGKRGRDRGRRGAGPPNSSAGPPVPHPPQLVPTHSPTQGVLSWRDFSAHHLCKHLEPGVLKLGICFWKKWHGHHVEDFQNSDPVSCSLILEYHCFIAFSDCERALFQSAFKPIILVLGAYTRPPCFRISHLEQGLADCL